MQLKKLTSNLIGFFISFFTTRQLIFINKFLKWFSHLVFERIKKKEAIYNIKLDNINFNLCAIPNSNQAHDVYSKLTSNKIYELPLVSSLLKVLSDKQFNNFLDVGSFMGYYSCLVSKYFENKKNINISAVESNKFYYEYIKKNLKLNKIDDIKIYNEILSDKVENLYFENEKVKKNIDINKSINATRKSILLDTLCDECNINPEVVKIDVHAFEHKVLKGFESNLKKNVKILFLELHSNSLLLNTSKSNKLEIIKYLFELDFCCFVTPFDGDLKIYNTDNKFEIMNYHSNYKEINIENFSDLFFDKLEKDNLIICVKKNLTGILKNV